MIEPGWLSLLPPLVAIGLALIFREVVVSLFLGVLLGAIIVAGGNPLSGLAITIDRFALEAVADPDHASIMIFTLLLGGMVGVIGRSGGTRGIVEAMRPFATSPRRAQLLTWAGGIAIFFDDYTNTLIVGNTMRPVTDGLSVSREKLSYIVDSTAAPMAAIAVISTWVGFEISLIGDALESAASQVADPLQRADLLAASEMPFTIFLHSIPYLFYPIFALLFVAIVIWMKRDFGPMHAAEVRARSGGGVSRPGAVLPMDVRHELADAEDTDHDRWYNAALPVLMVVGVALGGIWLTGRASLAEAGTPSTGVWSVVGAGNAFKGLLWGSLAGAMLAIGLAVGQRILKIQPAMEAFVDGMRSMMLALIILTLAWSLGGVTEALGTGPYLSSLIQESIPIQLLPAIVVVVAAAISFATGTSWGTMAILFPVVVPLAVAMGAGVNFDTGEHYTILLGVISSVMAGSIFGDHCSPISDTTVMSSLASACDHIDHVRTQLPYALTVVTVALLIGDIPTAFGLHPAISLVVGVLLLIAIARVMGKPAEEG
ncbi:MAG TPA: Na+/H+ antiporter NhaC family protein [Longimicrobiales bacterium]|nr:Na+/H+ antiporter NhaC family protein [Longimicrobiales bacterium]